MRQALLRFVALAALLLPLALHSAPATTPAPTARVIVKLKADSGLLRRQIASAAAPQTERAQALGQRLGLTLRSGVAVSPRAQVVTASGITSAELASRLAKQPDVEYAVVDQRRRRLAAPNDPLYGPGQAGTPRVGQWYLRAPAGEVVSSINVEPAWDITTGNPAIVVAVLDSGVRFDHVDLGGKLLPGYDMIDKVSTANDGDGRDADPSDPGDWISDADKTQNPADFGDCDVSDSSWHGTQVAGIVGAATNNGLGMAGAGRDVKILPVRVLGKCGGWDSDIVAGMRWAAGLNVPGVPDNPVANRARVLNLSLGSSGACDASTPYPDAMVELAAAGVVVVSSAGNDAGHAVAVPANCAGAIAVAGLRHVGTKVGFSDLGPEVALSAPGGNCVNVPGECLYPILTTSNSGTTVPLAGGSIYTDSFNISVGTSFAAPLVAGTAALMLSAQPALTPANVRLLLRSSARPFPTTGGTAGIPQCRIADGTDQDECYCTTATCGAGMLDAGAAVTAAIGLQAVIGVAPALPVATGTVTLSATGSLVAAGRSIVAYQWTLTDGGGIVNGFDGASNAETATLTPTAAGRFSVSLTITDDLANTSTVSRSVDVADVAVPVPPVPPPASGGGGGGALGGAWLIGLAAAVAALRRRR